MRSTHFYTALAIAAALAEAAAGQSGTTGAVVTAPTSLSQVAGTWEAFDKSSGGIGATVLLSPDGNFALVLGAMLDMHYKVDGNKFTIFGDDAGRKFSDTQTLSFVEDHPVLSGSGCKRTLYRLDPTVPDSGLVGRWKSTHMTGVPAYEDYTSAGQARLRVPIQVQKGSFSIDGGTIRFHTISPGPEDWNADFTVDRDTLAFSIGKEQQRYARARPLIPMEVQQPTPPSGLVCV